MKGWEEKKGAEFFRNGESLSGGEGLELLRSAEERRQKKGGLGHQK